MAGVMRTFKTASGTELPLINLKGKEYLQVAHRLQWFIEDNPSYDMATQYLAMDEASCICQVTVAVFNNEGRLIKRSTGVKRETKADFPDFIEKCQTGALGRALAALGYGTQFASDELDEGTRLADAPLEVVKTTPPSSNGKATSFRSRAPASNGASAGDDL